MDAPEPPPHLCCPITHELLADPVSTPAGHTYEFEAVAAAVRASGRDPMTRQPLQLAELRPNFAVRDAVEEWCRRAGVAVPVPRVARPQLAGAGAAPAPPEMAAAARLAAPEPFAVALEVCAPAHPSPAAGDAAAAAARALLRVRMPPGDSARRHAIDLSAVIDVSGSMSRNAQTSVEQQGYITNLAVVQHAMRVVVEMLAPDDRLAITSFESAGHALLPLTYMTASGKAAARAVLQSLVPNGATNMADGLRMGLAALEQRGPAAEAAARNPALFLLTDGEFTGESPLDALDAYLQRHPLPCLVNTYAFGSQLNSQILLRIAERGHGLLGFIPDASFVGTVIVNAVANLMSTVATGCTLVVRASAPTTVAGAPGYLSERASASELRVALGCLQFGQDRHVVVELGGVGAAAPLRAGSLSCELQAHGPFRSPALALPTRSAQLELGDACTGELEAHAVRTALVDLINRRLPTSGKTTAALALAALARRVAQSPYATEPFLAALLLDIDDQIAPGLEHYYGTWGQHYVQSIALAHRNELAVNFKDRSTAHYGGTIFAELRAVGDRLFCSVPGPTTSTGARAEMAIFHNRDNPCYHGTCTVELPDGSHVPLARVRRGMLVRTHRGFARVRCVLQTRITAQQLHLVRIGELLVTPYHPVRFAGSPWLFPLSVRVPALYRCDSVYSLVLDADHVVLVNGVETLTLGHGFRDGVAPHPFFGTPAILHALAQLDGWARGHIVVDQGCCQRGSGDLIERIVQASTDAPGDASGPALDRAQELPEQMQRADRAAA